VNLLKIKVGTLVLTASRDVSLPQEFAAWHQTVRVSPGTYDVFAYIEREGAGYRVRSLSAACEGITVSSNFRAHMFGTWGKSDNNRNGQVATASIELPTYGAVGEASPLLAQTTLCDAITRTEWEPSSGGIMWHLTWNSERTPIVIEQPRHGGWLSLAAFKDDRRFAVDGGEMSPAQVSALRLHFQHLFNADQLAVGESVSGWSFSDKRSLQVTRLA
jgi:hypothetical protein